MSIKAARAPVAVDATTAPLVVCAAKEGPDFNKILAKAASRALPSGAAGARAARVRRKRADAGTTRRR